MTTRVYKELERGGFGAPSFRFLFLWAANLTMMRGAVRDLACEGESRGVALIQDNEIFLAICSGASDFTVDAPSDHTPPVRFCCDGCAAFNQKNG